jgi:hypothetical protein
MRIIHGENYSDKERAEFRDIIYDNTLRAMKTLVQQCETVSEPMHVSGANREHVNKILEYPLPPTVKLNFADFAPAVQALWADAGIQNAYRQRNQFQIIDSAKYFFDEIQVLSSSSYVPSLQDVLRSRVATTGIVEYLFVSENVTFRMVDVGGQRSERRKWIHCFEGVTSILFVIGTSSYDTMLFEDNTTVREQIRICTRLAHTRRSASRTAWKRLWICLTRLSTTSGLRTRA